MGHVSVPTYKKKHPILNFLLLHFYATGYILKYFTYCKQHQNSLNDFYRRKCRSSLWQKIYLLLPNIVSYCAHSHNRPSEISSILPRSTRKQFYKLYINFKVRLIVSAIINIKTRNTNISTVYGANRTELSSGAPIVTQSNSDTIEKVQFENPPEMSLY